MNTRTTGIALLTSLACAVAGYSQTSTTSGAIRGTVSSKKGGAVANAKLILRNAETGFARTVVADAKGIFSFSYLPVGNYEITATAAGLKTVKNGNLRVSLGETATQNFVLDSAEAAAVVEVVADSANVDTTQLNTATAITQELVEAVPINGRNFTDLVQLTPGATAGGTNAYRTVVEGARGIYNNLQIDGASYNNKFSAENRGGTRVPYSFGMDSIRELQIISNAFDAQYGDASGVVVNAVTKSGTNEVTGMAMWLLRPNSLLANLRPVPYDPDGKINIPSVRTREFSQSQYAFNVGGPIIKDKLHYFVNAEYMKFSQRSQPSVGLNASSDKIEDYNMFWGITGPGNLTGAPGMGNIAITNNNGKTIAQESTSPWNNTFHNLAFLGRLDWTINPSHRMTLRLNNQTYKGDNDTWNRAVKNNESESNNNAYEIKNTSLVLELTSMLTSNLVNEARMQFSTEDRPVTPNSTISTAVSVTGLYSGQYSNAPARTKENLTQFIDNMSMMTGDWMFKGGVDLQSIDMTNNYLGSRGGGWYFNLAGANHWWANPSTLTTGDTAEYTQGWSRLDGHVEFKEKLFAGYMQAQYSGLLSKRLTLSLGLRYTREMWENNPSTNPILQNLDHMPDSGSLDPRFGFTFDLFGNSKTVIRGGYGVFSTSNPGQNAASAITNNGVNTKTYKATYASNGDLFASGALLNRNTPGRVVNNSIKPLTEAELLSLPASTVQLGIIDPEARMAQSKVITLGMEQDMGHGLVLGIRGTYKHFYHTQYWMDINMGQANPVTGLFDGTYNDGYSYRNNSFSVNARPGTAVVRGRTLDLTGYGAVYLSKYDGEGRYKGLVLTADRRSEGGFGFKSSLTFSKSEDNNSNERSTQATNDANPIDPSNPYRMALSDNDVPFKALFTGYSPKIYGFKLSGTVTYSKGYPYSAKYTNDTNGDGLKTDVVEAMGGRNGQRQPCRKTFDMRLSRDFRIMKTLSLEGIIDVYNVLNWANQTTGYQAYYTSMASTVPNANYSMINVNDDHTREVQFTLKARF